jgi:hypothetical protein
MCTLAKSVAEKKRNDYRNILRRYCGDIKRFDAVPNDFEFQNNSPVVSVCSATYVIIKHAH